MGYIELTKRKAELEFAGNILGKEVSGELKPILSKLESFDATLRRANIEITTPSQSELDALSKLIGELPVSEVKAAFHERKGPAFDIILKRGAHIKRNFQNRFEIAKLSMAAANLGTSEKASLSETIYFSRMGEKIRLSSADETTRRRIVKHLNRCGIFCLSEGDSIVPASVAYSEEVSYELPSGKVWVKSDLKSEIDRILEETRLIIPKVQLKTAEMQVIVFNDQQRAEHEAIQTQYLHLLRKKDELLRDFYDEEKLSVTIN